MCLASTKDNHEWQIVNGFEKVAFVLLIFYSVDNV